MKYQNKRNQKVATVIKEDQSGIITLQYEDGTTQNITESTRKRWFKLIEEAEVSESEEVSNSEQPSEVVEEVISSEIESVENKSESVTPDLEAITDKSGVIQLIKFYGLKYKTSEKGKNVSIYKDKQLLGILYVGPKVLTYYFNDVNIKKALKEKGFEVKESEEKFDFYSRINLRMFADILMMFR